ncbi:MULTISPECIES: TonB-dependent receptor [unclassified Sphingobium]|uniref:TonB-dependent receptor n=1 Tax=unclassified Sphingobium TaxID=2611147 RepID=UPI002225730D|nr:MULTISPECIES: TonB-dependent receptor [unclassified Sphingobium]MCW2413511.1 iron complex outermembrane receptor protein [Sphingobium sp. B8D3D]MCW2414189.1 iron complex outermembrane receptor protein [Sphingobium sp. B8D3A]
MWKGSDSLSGFCVLAALVATPGMTQTGPASEPSATIEDIVVTARRTAETLQNAPVAVSVIGGGALERAGITGLTDLQSRLPAVEFQTATSTPIVTVRGVGTFSTQAGVDSAIAYTVDGIFLAHPQAYPPVLVDIARVESLRGPQGTLYGRNSNGGAINFLTNEPVLGQVQANIALTAGNYATFGSEAMLNVPVGGKAAIRFAFGSNRRDGFYPDGYSNAADWVGRARLLVQPSDQLKIVLSADRSELSNDGAGWDYCPSNTTSALCAGRPFRPYTGLSGRNLADFNHSDSWSVYNQIDLTLPWATLTSLTGYRDNDFLARQTQVLGTSSSGFIQGVRSKLFTQELRLASPAQSPFKWLLGGFYARETGPASQTFNQDEIPYFSSDPHLVTTSKAVFGEVTVPLASMLRVIGGLRYTDEEKSATGVVRTISPTSTTELPILQNFRTRKWTWKAGAELDLAETSLVYATVSTGFKSGGINQVPQLPGFTGSYRPETITAYQLGSKNRLLGNRLQINGEVFYYDYKDFQALQVIRDAAIPGFFIQTTNSQKSSMYGGELEAEVAVSSAGRLSLAATWLHARFDTYIIGATNLSGKQIQAAPDFTLGGAYEHRFDFDSGARLTFGIDSKYVTGHFVANSNAPGSYQDGYLRSNASLTFETPNRAWQISAFVRNIEDKAQIAAFQPSANGDLVLLNPPRTFGATVKWRY